MEDVRDERGPRGPVDAVYRVRDGRIELKVWPGKLRAGSRTYSMRLFKRRDGERHDDMPGRSFAFYEQDILCLQSVLEEAIEWLRSSAPRDPDKGA